MTDRSVKPAWKTKGKELETLWNAIVHHTEGEELFWLGEILLSEITKETGYRPAPTLQPQGKRT